MDLTKTTRQEYEKNVCKLADQALEILKGDTLNTVEVVMFQQFLIDIGTFEFKPQMLLKHLDEMTSMQKTIAADYGLSEAIDRCITYLKSLE